ncbi:hypothetical protein [Sorangium sp. So ce363]|uniref:hypothetical protein n=1 Tax=Sorangium sp. So ce363 TaxID=3133304 RepID=UPI003F6472E9
MTSMNTVFGRVGSMFRTAVVPVATMLSLAFATPANAQKPGAHIVGDLTIAKSLATGLTVEGTGAGFGNFVTDAFLTADRVVATWQCRNPGGNIAPGQGTELTDVVGEPQTIEPRAGRIEFNVTLPVPPRPDPDIACPNGNWTIDPTPLSLTYFGVVLHFQQVIDNVVTEVLMVPLGDQDP